MPYNDTDGDPVREPGLRVYAHRGGYNVLYGDWSARWIGDSQERVIWTVPGTIWPGLQQNLSVNSIYNYKTLSGADPLYISPGHFCSVDAWHIFDADAGIDVK